VRLILLATGAAGAMALFASCSGYFSLNPNFRSADKCDPAQYETLLGQAYVSELNDTFLRNRAVVMPGGRLWPADGSGDFYRFYLDHDFSTILKIDCAKTRASVQLPGSDIPKNGGRYGPIDVTK
jgi:hypothetical protein